MRIFAGLLCFLLSVNAFSQRRPGDKSLNSYVSEIDKNLTVKRLGVLPVSDNVSGIYARTAESKLNSLVKNSHRFNFVEIKGADPSWNLDFYQRSPEKIKSLCADNKVDALIGVKVYKSQKGMEYVFDLLAAFDGNVLLEVSFDKDPKYDTLDIEKRTEQLYERLIKKLPYQGLVMSRQGNRVTVDLGKADGLKDNAIISAEQIIALNRHPKFKFLLGSDKEIVGKIRLVQVEETLSFGVVIQERSPEVIVPNSKIGGLDFVSYTDPGEGIIALPSNVNQTQTTGPKTDLVSFGKNPKAWVPQKKPTFGRIDLMLGLGTVRVSRAVEGANPASADSGMFPQIGMGGEIWLTPNWFTGGDFRQGILALSNNRDGSTPSRLNGQTSHYDLHLGYKLLLQDDFWGPQVSVKMGFSKMSIFVDDSTPRAYTSTSYRGLYFGLGGSMPIFEDQSAYVNIKFNRHISPALDESPISSGNSDNSVTTFGAGGMFRYNGDFWITGNMDLDFYSTTFTTAGAETGKTASQNYFTLYAGVAYIF